LRTLTDDLRLPLPPIDELLEEIDHPLLVKARAQFTVPDMAHERIRAIHDEAVWKVKVQRWRGAVWTQDEIAWLIAAGKREEGSPDDFYEALAGQARAARAQYNASHPAPARTKTLIGPLLPGADDFKRHLLENATRQVRQLAAVVRSLTARSLSDGHEHAADFPAFRVGIVVRADEGHETYIAVRVTGSIPDSLVSIILRNVPGCDPEFWDLVPRLPERRLLGPEQAWYNLMNPAEAAKLLNEEDNT
jgi:hypothetical protein